MDTSNLITTDDVNFAGWPQSRWAPERRIAYRKAPYHAQAVYVPTQADALEWLRAAIKITGRSDATLDALAATHGITREHTEAWEGQWITRHLAVAEYPWKDVARVRWSYLSLLAAPLTGERA